MLGDFLRNHDLKHVSSSREYVQKVLYGERDKYRNYLSSLVKKSFPPRAKTSISIISLRFINPEIVINEYHAKFEDQRDCVVTRVPSYRELLEYFVEQDEEHRKREERKLQTEKEENSQDGNSQQKPKRKRTKKRKTFLSYRVETRMTKMIHEIVRRVFLAGEFMDSYMEDCKLSDLIEMLKINGEQRTFAFIYDEHDEITKKWIEYTIKQTINTIHVFILPISRNVKTVEFRSSRIWDVAVAIDEVIYDDVDNGTLVRKVSTDNWRVPIELFSFLYNTGRSDFRGRWSQACHVAMNFEDNMMKLLSERQKIILRIQRVLANCLALTKMALIDENTCHVSKIKKPAKIHPSNYPHRLEIERADDDMDTTNDTEDADIFQDEDGDTIMGDENENQFRPPIYINFEEGVALKYTTIFCCRVGNNSYNWKDVEMDFSDPLVVQYVFTIWWRYFQANSDITFFAKNLDLIEAAILNIKIKNVGSLLKDFTRDLMAINEEVHEKIYKEVLMKNGLFTRFAQTGNANLSRKYTSRITEGKIQGGVDIKFEDEMSREEKDERHKNIVKGTSSDNVVRDFQFLEFMSNWNPDEKKKDGNQFFDFDKEVDNDGGQDTVDFKYKICGRYNPLKTYVVDKFKRKKEKKEEDRDLDDDDSEKKENNKKMEEEIEIEEDDDEDENEDEGESCDEDIYRTEEYFKKIFKMTDKDDVEVAGDVRMRFVVHQLEEFRNKGNYQ